MSDISDFLVELIDDDARSKTIFGLGFQSLEQWYGYLEEHFGSKSDVHATWKKKNDPKNWSPGDFQALYVACWIYKPVEKGTYLLRMTPKESHYVKKGFEKLPTRKSSHLDGKGRSAHRGWAFLKGYDELLVQWSGAGDRCYLLLKCEGHTTGLSGIIPHMSSWVKKKRTGAGNTANPQLHDLAASADSPVVLRAAENFSKGYEKFLKKLGRKSATTSVRDMLGAVTGTDWSQANNATVRGKLTQLAASSAPIKGSDADNVDDVKEQFRRFAKLFKLENRPERVYPRFFEEVHVAPDQLMNAMQEFRTRDMHRDLRAQTQRRSKMHRQW